MILSTSLLAILKQDASEFCLFILGPLSHVPLFLL
jgi:hypothetical protein